MSGRDICFKAAIKSFIVENDLYLLQLSYYINRNLLRAGCIKRLIDYHWSSYPVYVYQRRYLEWLDTLLIHYEKFNSQIKV